MKHFFTQRLNFVGTIKRLNVIKISNLHKDAQSSNKVAVVSYVTEGLHSFIVPRCNWTDGKAGSGPFANGFRVLAPCQRQCFVPFRRRLHGTRDARVHLARWRHMAGSDTRSRRTPVSRLALRHKRYAGHREFGSLAMMKMTPSSATPTVTPSRFANPWIHDAGKPLCGADQTR